MLGDVNKTVTLHRDQRLRQVYLDVPSVLINSPTAKTFHKKQETDVHSNTVANFRQAVLRWQDAPFLAFRSGLSCNAKLQVPRYETITFIEADQMVNRLAAAFRYLGLGYQKKLGLLGSTSPLMFISDLAITALGGISVLIPLHLSYEHTIYAINHSGIRVLLTQARFLSMILGIANRCPFLRLVLTLDQVPNDFEVLPRAAKIYAQLSGRDHLLYEADSEENSLSENVIDRSYLNDIAEKNNIVIDAILESTKEYEDEQKNLRGAASFGIEPIGDAEDHNDMDLQRGIPLAAHFNNVNPLNPATLGIPDNKVTDILTKQIMVRAQFNDFQSRFTTPMTAMKMSHLHQGKKYSQILSKELYDLLPKLRIKEHLLEETKDCINGLLYSNVLENINIVQLDQLLDLTKRDVYTVANDYPLRNEDIWSIVYSEVGYTSKYSSIDYFFNTCNRDFWHPGKKVDKISGNGKNSLAPKKFDQFSQLISDHPVKANVYSHKCFLAAINSHFYRHFPYNRATFSGIHSSYYCHLPYCSMFERIMEHGAISRGYRLVFHAGEFQYLFADMLLGRPTIFAASPRFFKKLHHYLVEFLTKISANKKKLFEKTYNFRLAKLQSIYSAMEKAHSLVYILDTIEYFEKQFQSSHQRNVDAVTQATDEDSLQIGYRSAHALASTGRAFDDSGTQGRAREQHKRTQSYAGAKQLMQVKSNAKLTLENRRTLDQFGVESFGDFCIRKDDESIDIANPWIPSGNIRTKSLHTFKMMNESIGIGDGSEPSVWPNRMRKINSKEHCQNYMQGEQLGEGNTEDQKFDKYMKTIATKVSAPLSSVVKEFVPPDEVLRTVQSKTKISLKATPLLPKNSILYSDNSDQDNDSEISEKSIVNESTRSFTAHTSPPHEVTTPVSAPKTDSPFKMRKTILDSEPKGPATSNTRDTYTELILMNSSLSESGTQHSGDTPVRQGSNRNNTEVSYTVTSISTSKQEQTEAVGNAHSKLVEVRKQTRSTHSEAMAAIQAEVAVSFTKDRAAAYEESKVTKAASARRQKELLKLQKQQQKHMNKMVRDKTAVTRELNKLHFDDNLKVALKPTFVESPVIQRVQNLFGESLEFIISNSVLDNVDTWKFLRTILGCHGCQLVGYSELSGGGLYNEVHDQDIGWSLGRAGIGVKCKIVDLSEGWFPDILTRLILNNHTPDLYKSNRKLYIQMYNKLEELIAGAMPRFIDTQLGELCLAGNMLSMGYYAGDPLYQYSRDFNSEGVLTDRGSSTLDTASSAPLSARDSTYKDNETSSMNSETLSMKSMKRPHQQEQSDSVSNFSAPHSVSIDSVSWKDADMDVNFLAKNLTTIKQTERRKSLIIAKKNAKVLGVQQSVKSGFSTDTDSREQIYTVGSITGQTSSQTVTGVPLISLHTLHPPTQTQSSSRRSSTSNNASLAADIAAATQAFVPTLLTPATTNPFSAPLNRNQTKYTSNTSLSLGSYMAGVREEQSRSEALLLNPTTRSVADLSKPASQGFNLASDSQALQTSVPLGTDSIGRLTLDTKPYGSAYHRPSVQSRADDERTKPVSDRITQPSLIPIDQLRKPFSDCLIDSTDSDGYYHTGDMVEFEQLSGRIVYRGTIREYLDKNLYPIIEKFIQDTNIPTTGQNDTAENISPSLSPKQLDLCTKPGKVSMDMWPIAKALALRLRHQLCGNLNLTYKLSSSHYLNVGFVEELIATEIPYIIDVILYTFDGASRPMAFLYIKGSMLLESMKQGGIKLHASESGEGNFETDKFTNSKTVIYATLAKLNGEQKERLVSFLKGNPKGAQTQRYVMRTGQCAFFSTSDNARIITYIKSDIRLVLKNRNLPKYFAPITILYIMNSDMLLTEPKLRTITGKRNREEFFKKFSGDIARYKQDEGVPELILH